MRINVWQFVKIIKKDNIQMYNIFYDQSIFETEN